MRHPCGHAVHPVEERDRIAGAALQQIAREPGIARAMFEILETQKLVEGEAAITLVPQGNELLKQLVAVGTQPKAPA